MQKSSPFSRAIAMFAAFAASMRGPAQEALIAGGYLSRGKGEGLPGNKRAKPSFKPNKRQGL